MDDKLLAKIKKILILGNESSSSNESEVALKLAYDLMSQNNLTIQDIQRHSKDEVLGKLGKSQLDDNDKLYRVWEISLVTAIAKLFDCQVMKTRYKGSRYKKSTVSIIGREDNRITTKTMYDWIRTKTLKEARRYNTASSRKAYCVGVATSIIIKVDKIKDTAPKTDKWGIVPVDEVENYISTQFADVGNTDLSLGSVKDAKAYYSGRSAGDTVSLNRQFGLKGIEAKQR